MARSRSQVAIAGPRDGCTKGSSSHVWYKIWTWVMVPHLAPPHMKWGNTWEPHEEACRYFIFHFFKDFGQRAQCGQMYLVYACARGRYAVED